MLTKFIMEVAQVSIGVTCLFPSTKERCREFLTDREPELLLTIDKADVEAELKLCEDQKTLPQYAEFTALLRKIAEDFLQRDRLFFHACCLVKDGEAVLFTAPSGTGKSTHAGIWMKNIPDCWILNGDKPFLGFRDGVPTVFGTPWKGKEGWGRNACAPLKAIVLLERGEENRIFPITAKEAFTRLLMQSYRPASMELLPVILLLTKIAEQTSLYRLACNMQPEAALIACGGIYGNL